MLQRHANHAILISIDAKGDLPLATRDIVRVAAVLRQHGFTILRAAVKGASPGVLHPRQPRRDPREEAVRSELHGFIGSSAGAAAEVDDFIESLQQTSATTIGRVLRDQPRTSTELGRLLTAARHWGNSLFIYIQGHGIKTAKGYGMMLPEGKPFPMDQIVRSVVRWETTNTPRLHANVMIMIDACHSGAALDGIDWVRLDENEAAWVEPWCIEIITATNKVQEGVAGDKSGALFTEAFLTMLRGEIDERDGGLLQIKNTSTLEHLAGQVSHSYTPSYTVQGYPSAPGEARDVAPAGAVHGMARSATDNSEVGPPDRLRFVFPWRHWEPHIQGWRASIGDLSWPPQSAQSRGEDHNLKRQCLFASRRFLRNPYWIVPSHLQESLAVIADNVIRLDRRVRRACLGHALPVAYDVLELLGRRDCRPKLDPREKPALRCEQVRLGGRTVWVTTSVVSARHYLAFDPDHDEDLEGPATCVPFEAALDFCGWVSGGRLPTHDELQVLLQTRGARAIEHSGVQAEWIDGNARKRRPWDEVPARAHVCPNHESDSTDTRALSVESKKRSRRIGFTVVWDEPPSWIADIAS